MPRLVAALSAAGALMIVPTTIVGGHLAGYKGVALAYAVTNGALVPANFSLLKRFGRVGFGELWARTWRVTLAALVMLALLWAAFPEPVYASSVQAAAILALKVLVGAATYVFILLGSWAVCGTPDGPEKSVLRTLRAWLVRS
jgi:O-antigen/teichoic acid export membrane protein